MTGKPCPPYGILALLDPLFSRTSLIVKMHHRFGASAQIGDNKPNPWKQFSPVPFHFGNNSTGTIPALGLILKVPIPHMGFFGGSANGTNQKRSNLIHERIIGWKTNGIPKAFLLQILVDAGIGK